jgi:hypothetical protein
VFQSLTNSSLGTLFLSQDTAHWSANSLNLLFISSKNHFSETFSVSQDILFSYSFHSKSVSFCIVSIAVTHFSHNHLFQIHLASGLLASSFANFHNLSNVSASIFLNAFSTLSGNVDRNFLITLLPAFQFCELISFMYLAKAGLLVIQLTNRFINHTSDISSQLSQSHCNHSKAAYDKVLTMLSTQADAK